MKIFNWAKNSKTTYFTIGNNFYLSKEQADKLKKIDIKEISLMESQDRLGIFSKIIGEEKAGWLNAHFERDLILKNQKEGMLKWAKETEMKEKFRQEIIRKISKLEKALSLKEEEAFLEELSRLTLGLELTEEEVRTIFDLSQKVEEAKKKLENGGSKIDYYKACNNLQQYVDVLKHEEL